MDHLPQQMKVNDTRSVLEETLTAFERLKAASQLETEQTLIASREDYESDEYARLCSRLSDANEHYHMLGGGGNQEGRQGRLFWG